MEINIKNNGIELIAADGFDLKNTFDCGQCFRWDEQPDGSYTGIAKGKRLRIYPTDKGLFLEGCAEDDFGSSWRDYFDLDTDYDAIKTELVELCPALKCAADSISGIRILRQEPWEALCSFIISQNNNIPRIKGIISRLCEGWGEKHDGYFGFPSADTLSRLSVEELAPLRAGFRARYIIDAARRVAGGEIALDDMYSMPIADCRRELMKIVGVGAKVAECTLLYGLHRLEAFPVDVWMKKALAQSFSGVTAESLGRYAGIAQQYIFHYTRNISS